jgi:3-deoxy-D-arabino-heptulosonate 7-phosphate (DAHP) synthase class II
VVTNVPGPREHVYLAGARVAGTIAWVPRAGDMGFGVSIFSYAGDMLVGFSTDEHLMPDPQRLQDLMLAELDALRGLA